MDEYVPERPEPPPAPAFPRLEGNALITASGETLGPICLLDRLYLRCGITSAEELEAIYRAGLA